MKAKVGTPLICDKVTAAILPLLLMTATLSAQNLDLATLPSAAGCRYIGGKLNSGHGYTISSAGDFNGDGYADFIAGACFAQNGTYTESGAAYISFGKANGYGDVDYSIFDTTNAGGFRINISQSSAQLGYSVAGIGDFNGDGFDDVLVGSNPGSNGKAYVIFGKAAGHSNIEVSTFSSSNANGFVISSATSTDKTGATVSGAGDVNWDGLDDLIIGAYGSSTAYVLFGRSSPAANISLASFTASDSNGYRISGFSNLGYTISSAGDFNNDGFDDILVGKRGGPPYLIYGKSTNYQDITISFNPTNPDVLHFDSNGIDVSAGSSSVMPVPAIAEAGDFNGDGYSDVALGANSSDNNSRTDSGSVYVVWGRQGTTQTIALKQAVASSTEGFRIDGWLQGSFLGVPVRGAGDVNGDGYDDLFVTAPQARLNGRNSGYTYLVYGKSTVPANIDLATNFTSGVDGYRLEGAVEFAPVMQMPAAAGDVNGDGFGDILINQGMTVQNTPTGVTYLVFGAPSQALIKDWQLW